MPVVGSIEWDSDEDRARRRHHHKASTVHGWLTKMRGTLLGSESTRRRGIREMREARAIRRYKQEHPEAFRGRNGNTILWIFPRRSTRRTHHHHSHHHGHAPSHSHSHSHSRHRHHRRHHGDSHHRYDDRYRERYSKRHPFLHFHHRVRPHHHGVGTYLAGLFLGNRHLREKGRYLMSLARKERHRERHKRRRQRRDEALDMRMYTTVHSNRWWHR
ncbi:hypothetical protein BD414DRAFT_474410 [Trametes punicea]|nr:hypothetical protein BD414DRAFT_474410 [Trametes punicea]